MRGACSGWGSSELLWGVDTALCSEWRVAVRRLAYPSHYPKDRWGAGGEGAVKSVGRRGRDVQNQGGQPWGEPPASTRTAGRPSCLKQRPRDQPRIRVGTRSVADGHPWRPPPRHSIQKIDPPPPSKASGRRDAAVAGRCIDDGPPRLDRMRAREARGAGAPQAGIGLASANAMCMTHRRVREAARTVGAPPTTDGRANRRGIFHQISPGSRRAWSGGFHRSRY